MENAYVSKNVSKKDSLYTITYISGKTHHANFGDSFCVSGILGFPKIDRETQFMNPEIAGWAMGFPEGWVMDVFKI